MYTRLCYNTWKYFLTTIDMTPELTILNTEQKTDILEYILLDKRVMWGLENFHTSVKNYNQSIVTDSSDFFFQYYQLLDKILPNGYTEGLHLFLHDFFFGSIASFQGDFNHEIKILANNIELLMNSEAEEKWLIFSLLERCVNNLLQVHPDNDSIKYKALKESKDLLSFIKKNDTELALWVEDIFNKHLAFDLVFLEWKELKWYIEHHLHVIELIENKIFEEFTK